MERRNRINNFFHFLEEKGEDQSNFESILDKLNSEIELETKYDNNLLTNEYLNALIQTKNGQMQKYRKAKGNGFVEDTEHEFVTFIDYLMQDVSLFGLGVAQ